MNKWFSKFSDLVSKWSGSSYAFISGLILIIIWGVSGPYFHFSDTWQLIANTFTTLITFLMVFLIQHTQERNEKILHLKIDELIKSLKGARNSMINLEKKTDEELSVIEKEFDEIE
jgi:low affinity Fe/Cu permease